MNAEGLEYPTTIAEMQAMLESQARYFETQLAKRDSTIELLREQLRLLQAQRFGASSERVAEGQFQLFNEAELEALSEDETSEPDIIEVPAHRRVRPRRKPIPEHLPRVPVVHDLEEHEKFCPHDGAALKVIDSEVSEQLDIIPATVQVLEHRRLTYACPCCKRHVKTAPMTRQPIPKSLASPGLLAYAATSKFVDSLPLYRQVQIFARLGIDLSRATLATWMVRCGQLVQPLINLLREELLAGPYLHMDESTLQVLKEAGKAPESKSYLWVQHSGASVHPIVLFDYDPTRSGEVPKRLLEGFEGALHTDGYDGYNLAVRELFLVHLFCWAHVRRKVVDALKAQGLNPKKLPAKPPDKARRALKLLGLIKTLYAIERRIKDHPPDERYRVRQAEAIPVLEALKCYADEIRPKVTPQSLLGKALTYMHNLWPGLVRYTEDGRYSIDNNIVENAIRPFCLGRKNWLFADTVAGANSSANLYSLIATAKANGLEPYAYLRHVFTELPKAETVEAIEALLPTRIDPSVLDNNRA